ncbi:related to telomere length regulator protein rif1 [Fusarium fujikuroi IMI 58289]|uniref:Related to telomere length regulator protein rif1 n=1 Tax=Gibberella fujikuroi (strain CBS 195.34 / IMI 58289 / NRRL A-6831) TaxID=1279085 RepID=S0DHR1_GIBF5|nr:related to telomere length regulator protein rif1 [Fusarium fujikuroi IMI 58289]CCT61789.1 related to telomere length regulator protein rif1 [Fusarium fujikuroi IMI 58289]SCO11881.1 related to telomere length regulator protein rif1 [Fusarium fujikuroi]SCV53478.1 related to telomere length regulator protein rif1 [Fusarium fujikuroi]
MASSAKATTLDELSPRPPTPPRESLPDKLAPMKASVGRPIDPRLSLQTPPGANTPSSNGATNTNSSSRRIRKKVEWSSHTEYREASKFFRSSPITTPSASSRPVKGILKPSPSPNPLASPLNGHPNGLSSQISIAEMLDSTIKQLAGSDRDSRLDAYMMLSRALKASNNLPDRVALQDKMSLFMSFIERDVKSKRDEGSPDSSLIFQALSLLTTFLHFPAIASSLTSDFGVFIIDHCIRCFSDPGISKDLARHLMQVVAFQSFSPKVMSSDRVGRLVTSLHNIEDHLTGKSIIMGRIQIYKRLVKQSRNHMAVHTAWLEDLFNDMLTPIRDIRAQAILLGTEAGFSLRNEKPVMRKVTEILQSTADKQIYIQYYIQRLDNMLKEKQLLSTVPQIWGAVTLFLQCPLSRWQHFAPWFKIAQDSFNCTELQTKLEANYAWNRYVYLSITSNKLPPKSLGVMSQPLASQLRRKFSSKQSEEAMKLRRTVMGGICNLCYYAFRPSQDVTWIDAAWDSILVPITQQLVQADAQLEFSADSVTQATRIVTGLLDVSTPRSWKDDRIRDVAPISPEELPSIDSRWARRNSEKIFGLVGPILEKKFHDLANTESLAYRLWQAFVGSIAVASAKDIKVTDETARFIAQAFDLLSKVWSTGLPEGSESAGTKYLSSVRHYVDVLVRNLGLLPFTEKKLSMSLANTFEPASTPSRIDRADKSNGTVQTPLYHLFSILCSKPPGLADDEDLAECFLAVFDPFFQGKSSRARVELSREMLRLLPRDALSPYGPWVLAAQNIRTLLDQNPSPSGSLPPSSERLLGPEYREIVSLLERGLVSHPTLPEEQWFSLFNLLSDHIAQESGDAGRALGLVEPLAKIVTDNFFEDSERSNQMALAVAIALFKIAKLPRDRQAVEAARRRLWGAPPTASRSSSFDPFQYLYQLQGQSMKYFYENEAECNDQKMVAYFEAVNAFIVASFAQNGFKTLPKLQTGLVPWIQDEKAHKMLRSDSPVSGSVQTLWDSICGQLLTLGRLEDKVLNTVEPLVAAGFRSKHRHVVNKMAEMWNALVKDEESLDCSESLKSIIASLRPRVDVSFPGMEHSSGEFGAQAQTFVDTQEDLSFVALSSAKSSGQGVEQAASPAPSISKMSLRGATTRKRRRDATPESTKAKPAKRTATPRLRHDNSQIQFAPIVSSPLVGESQHLTERQREVRERQEENASLYPGIRSSPRTRAQAAIEESSKDAEMQKPSRLETTPERAASYDEFINLTPTPRRGQALHLEGLNDPPSSPPDPRRNPLLSEIQTRSKARDSIVNWQFSSPPGSPSISQQTNEDQAEVETPSAKNKTSGKTTRSKRRRRRAESSKKEEVIPSSLDSQEVVAEDVEALPDAPPSQDVDEIKEEHTEPPALTQLDSPQRTAPPPAQVLETPKSADDEFVDARSSPAKAADDQAVESGSKVANSQNQDSSFALSEGDESSLMRFVVELESRRCHLPFDKYNSVSVSPEKKKNDASPEKCIEVQGDTSVEAEQNDTKESSPSSVVPSTPVESSQEKTESRNTNQTDSKRKRKRSAMYAETRRKKRRSADPSGPEQVEDSQSTSQETASPIPTVRRSSRRNAGQKGKVLRNREVQASPTKRSTRSSSQAPQTTSKSTDPRDDGDTDEELMSQLVTESFAASQSQEPEFQVPDEVIEDSMKVIPIDNESGEEVQEDQLQAEEEGQNEVAEPKEDDDEEEEETPVPHKTRSIMDTLRGGLQQLQAAALSRDEVYQLEDMLMDMKRELFEAERRGRH